MCLGSTITWKKDAGVIVGVRVSVQDKVGVRVSVGVGKGVTATVGVSVGEETDIPDEVAVWIHLPNPMAGPIVSVGTGSFSLLLEPARVTKRKSPITAIKPAGRNHF